MQQRAERRRQSGMLAHYHLAVADLYAADCKIRPGMREPRARDELVRGGQVPKHGVVGDAEAFSVHDLEGPARPGSNRDHDVGMGLIRLIEHSPTQPCPKTISGRLPPLHRKMLVHFMLRCEIISLSGGRAPSQPGKSHGYADDCQQELRLLVVARLVALQNGWPRVRGRAGKERRPRDARRAAPAVAIVPGAVPAP